ncbi:FAD/NAD-P-binding domain-containing protein [Trametes coccinea BRFM310]|uniref:FAD/NAD-P-binding domain-containing protein n=1 Tax=Trametes coccinea (strain BRFM310) TaxID=1353009 RepID=A0A1Y2J059_TRAC3|nr:FAD/NAD-P-binding domain-containing protein [Trametes coccinea BRFM310]
MSRVGSGGGIAGLTLAAAIHKHAPADAPVEVNIYEADSEVRTAGAGITVWPRTWDVMRELGLYDALSAVAVKSSSTSTSGNEVELKPAFVARKANQPTKGFNYGYVYAPTGSTTMHRRDMIDVFLQNLPSSYRLHTSKRLKSYTTRPRSPTSQSETVITLQFADGTTAEADVLVGADGIHSATRCAMYAQAHERECVPQGADESRWQNCDRCRAAEPVWTGVHSYRCLIPTEELYALNPKHTTATIGSILCHIITYQISGGKFLNFVALCREPKGEGSPYVGPWVTGVPREEVLSKFALWEPEVQQMLQCVRNPTRWAIHVVDKLPFAVRDNVALVGDAMHAMPPNFGAGGGQAIEDAYILGCSLAARTTATRAHIPAVLRTYEQIRLPFTRDVARRAREVGLMYEFNAPGYYSAADGEGVPETETETDKEGRARLEALGEAIRDMWGWQWKEDAFVWADPARNVEARDAGI